MSTVPVETVKQAMRATWMAGDFGAIARTNARAAELFVDSLELSPGARALDVACGTGNVTIPLARRGASVTGVDIAPNLLEQARARAGEEKLDIAFHEGDAEALPWPDQAFDLATSMFGAMFAPRPEVVASEFARVLAPGGLLAMANWTPASFPARLAKTTARHAAPPAHLPPPHLWGDEAVVRERLAPHFTNIETETVPLEFEVPAPPRVAAEWFSSRFGPLIMAFGRLDEGGRKALGSDLHALWAEANLAPEHENRTVIRNEYLRVTARRA